MRAPTPTERFGTYLAGARRQLSRPIREATKVLTPLLAKSVPLLQGLGVDVAGMVPGDLPYFEQYMTPERSTLRQQALRPRATRVDPSADVRQTPLPAQFQGIGFGLLPTGTYVEPKESLAPARLTQDRLNALKKGEIIRGVEPDTGSETITKYLRGLGRYTGSISRDDRGLYWSAFDRWDMNSPSIPAPIRAILEGLGGQDFVVYDRFRMTPRSGGGFTFTREEQ